MHRREESRPNALWQADHAQLDILLLREDGATARPWLTAIIDDHSRAIAGYYLSFDPPSSFRTSLALRQGIWRKVEPHWQICVIPDVLYTDNGADFSSRHLEQVAIDLKMRLVFSTPCKPQGRGKIERFFRTVNETFLCDLEDGTRRGRRKPTLSLGELAEKFRNFVVEIYSRTAVAEAELSPAALWERGGFLPRMPESLEQLDLLLIEKLRSRRIRRDGIHFASRIGFVHEFRPPGDVEMQQLLEHRWTPVGISLPEATLTPEVIARLIRITSGNPRLLTRLLTQIERVLSVNDAPEVSVQIVEAARDSLAIGQA